MNSDLNQKNNVIIAAGIGAIGLGVAAYGFFTKNKNSETSGTTNESVETVEKTNDAVNDEVSNNAVGDEVRGQWGQEESSNEENTTEDNEKAVVEAPFAMADIWKSFWKTQYENVKQGTTVSNQDAGDDDDDGARRDPVVQEALDSAQIEMENVTEELQGGQGEQGEQGEQGDRGDEIPKIIESDNKILSGDQ